MTNPYRAMCAKLVAALDNLLALVNGECPSLLDGDRGGSGFLDIEIDDALTTARALLAQPEPEWEPMPLPGDAEGLAEVYWAQPAPEGPTIPTHLPPSPPCND